MVLSAYAFPASRVGAPSAETEPCLFERRQSRPTQPMPREKGLCVTCTGGRALLRVRATCLRVRFNVSIATPLTSSKGGPFVLAKAKVRYRSRFGTKRDERSFQIQSRSVLSRNPTR